MDGQDGDDGCGVAQENPTANGIGGQAAKTPLPMDASTIAPRARSWMRTPNSEKVGRVSKQQGVGGHLYLSAWRVRNLTACSRVLERQVTAVNGSLGLQLASSRLSILESNYEYQ